MNTIKPRKKKRTIGAVSIGLLFLIPAFLVMFPTSNGSQVAMDKTVIKINRIQIVDKMTSEKYKIEFAAVQISTTEPGIPYGTETLDSWEITELEYHYISSPNFWLNGWDDSHYIFGGSECIVGSFDGGTTGKYLLWMKVTKDDFWYTTASYGIPVEDWNYDTEYTHVYHFGMFGGEIQVWFEVQLI